LQAITRMPNFETLEEFLMPLTRYRPIRQFLSSPWFL
jgi:hypothetical protein